VDGAARRGGAGVIVRGRLAETEIPVLSVAVTETFDMEGVVAVPRIVPPVFDEKPAGSPLIANVYGAVPPATPIEAVYGEKVTPVGSVAVVMPITENEIVADAEFDLESVTWRVTV
jgi:hypothetical protein